MDDATSTLSDRPAGATATATAPVKPFAGKPRRLARGLNDLFLRQGTPVKVSPSQPDADEPVESKTPLAAETAAPQSHVLRPGSRHDHPASTPAAAPGPVAAPSSAAEATATHDAVAGTTSAFEYRFVQLISRLDATCNLLADARQTHLAAAQRNGRIAWSVAAVLTAVAGGSLWWSGSMAAWNQSKFEYESARSAVLEKSFNSLTAQHAAISTTHQSLAGQHQSLAKQHDLLVKQHESVRGEIDAIRTSLAKANGVIDELMTAPKVEPPKAE